MIQEEFYRLSAEESATRVGADLQNGLTSAEAARRLAEGGANEFEKKKHTSLLTKFVSQFKSFMILVLIAAAVISGVVGYIGGEGFVDAIIIMIIVVINAIIGVFQEAKAEKSLDALERMSAPQCKVLRDGEVVVVPSRELVVGDVVVIETGDSVPADLRLVEATNLKVQEAALTGESLPVEKHTLPLAEEAPIGDRVNMAFGSCSVTYGHGRGVVVATGVRSEVGKIAAMIQSVPEMKTPMQERLDKLGKTLAVAALAICAVIFVVGLLYGNPLLEMFMTAVSLAAAAIPEGLPAVSTIVLAMGVQRLAGRNAIVRNLPSVETLGSTTVICSDKTGTLTQNRMTVMKVYADGRLMEPSEESEAIGRVVHVAVLANDTTVSRSESGEVENIGDPTETALVDLGFAVGVDKEQEEGRTPRVAEIPFDSERKLMTTLHRTEEDHIEICTKGGVDELLACCDSIEEGGVARPLTEADRGRIAQENVQMASQALRVLAMAHKVVEQLPQEITPTEVERGLTYVGMVGMIDPPREEVKAAVAECKAAGIRPVMITGDHLITASAIGRSLGIYAEGDSALTGAEVERMSSEDLRAAAATTSVFARVAPEHKVRIVEAYQQRGNIVAMTGDGVNDAPALKLADIGVAMGITGTDVSKEAADVVLADDNFATIVSAVSEGRRIYDNLMKSIQFMLSTNFGEIMVLFVAVIVGHSAPLLPIHILWINLVTDSLPALALSFDPAERDIMRRGPINSKQGIMTRGFALRTLLQGALVATASLLAYNIGAHTSVEAAQTMTFATVAFSQMTLIFSIRSGMHAAVRGLFANGFLWGAIAFVLVLMLGVMLLPALQGAFHVVSLSSTQWLWVGGLSLGVLLVSEITKLGVRLMRK
ncbi:MAG: calcium-translocating P-type ATPase, PMCA-type [Tidjanibacter sp.]|nr:calcium-translocating P-type ATPase, PMCA-type [Tidjanibacter sp.]